MPDDVEAIADGHVASWREAYRELMPAAYLDALSRDESSARWRESLGREDARLLIGYATVGPDEEPVRGMLLLMYVRERAWGTGAGRELMIAAEDALRELGYADAVLWVLERNERARRFYETAGWSADGGRQSQDYGGVTLEAIRYARAL